VVRLCGQTLFRVEATGHRTDGQNFPLKLCRHHFSRQNLTTQLR